MRGSDVKGDLSWAIVDFKMQTRVGKLNYAPTPTLFRADRRRDLEGRRFLRHDLGVEDDGLYAS